MVRTKQIKKTVVIDFQMNFEDGIVCYYTTSNGELTNYYFKNHNKTRLSFVSFENVDKIKTQHWSTHHELVGILGSREEIENYYTQGELYYLGCGSDGMVKDKHDTFLSSIVNFDMSFLQSRFKIETTEEECETILSGLKSEYITESNIAEIPYYNCGNVPDHFSISLKVLLPDDVYRKLLGNKKHVDDDVKIRIFEFLKK